ncbi:hypothetical protein [Streptomyces sp. MUSC 14]|nr:hypothetical protein [Streptomyces sp. MUSC 14]
MAVSTCAGAVSTSVLTVHRSPQITLFGDIMSNEFRIMTVVRPGDT